MGAERTVTFGYTIVGSGFGGSVSAMRLSEKGYKVLVLWRCRTISCSKTHPSGT